MSSELVVEKVKIVAGLLVFTFLLVMGWQIASCEFHNYLLKDDLKDLAAMGGVKVGLFAPPSDAEFRLAVIRKGREHGLHIAPDQILIRRSGTRDNPIVFLAAKYHERVWMPGFRLIFHYTATSTS